MKMHKIALLASQNGFGHSRRLFYVGSALQEWGYSTTLFLGAVQAQYLSDEMSPNNISLAVKIIKPLQADGPHVPPANFQTASTFDSVIDNESILISDNIVLTNSQSPYYYLHGHFNWLDYENLTNCKEGLPAAETLSYGNLLGWFKLNEFQLKSDIPESKCHSIPFLRYNDLQKFERSQLKNVVWVSKGTTSDFDLTSLNRLKAAFPELQFVDLESYKLRVQTVLPVAVIGRPGLGTIKDCLEAGVPFVPIGYNFDVELTSNVNNLVRLGLLASAENPVIALKAVLENPEIYSDIKNYWVENSISMHEYATRIAKVIS